MADFYGSYPVMGGSGGVPIYATFAAFPAGTVTGQLAVAADTGILYEWNGSAWVAIAGPGAALSIGAFGSTPNNNGLTLSSNVLNMEPADATHPGGVSTTTQSFAGNKTFTGDVGVGIAPDSNLTVYGNSATATFHILREDVISQLIRADAYSGSSMAIANASFICRAARGTIASPSAIQSGDLLLNFGARGYGATAFTASNKVRMQFMASENWTDSAQGTLIAFATTPTGGMTIAERMRITDSGSVGVGTTTPTTGTQLDITGTSATNSSIIIPRGTVANRPVTGVNGMMRYASDSNKFEVYENGAWTNMVATPLSLSAFGSSPNANAGTITGTTLVLQPADATNPGGVSTTTQSFAGNKTFTGTIAASNLSGTNTGDVTIGTANGLSLVGQALSLGLSSTSTTGALSSTDWNFFNDKLNNSLTSAHIFVGNGSNIPADVAMTGDISLTNAGVTAYAGTVPLNKGGTGQTTKAPAFDALSPMTTGGDLIYGGASGTGTRLANGSANQYLASAGGTSAPVWTSFVASTTQVFTTGSGTYTLPTSPRSPIYIRVRMVGGGGGGGGSGTSPGSPSAGGNTTFSTFTASGGSAAGGAGGAGGTASGATINIAGGSGSARPSVATITNGGSGGYSAFGGGGSGGNNGPDAGEAGKTNSGGGGGGAGCAATIAAGSGGGAGGYCESTIASPSATYSYAVGAGGGGGSAGTNGAAGGAGGSGIIIVQEYYQ